VSGLACRRVVTQQMDCELGSERLGVESAGQRGGFDLADEPSGNIFDAGIARAEDVQKLDRSRAVRYRVLDDSRNERWREAQLDELGFLLVPQRPRLAGGGDDDVPGMQGALVDAPGALLHEIDGAAQEHRD